MYTGHGSIFLDSIFNIWVLPKPGVSPKWMVKIMENPIKMDDLGVPLFSETPIWPLLSNLFPLFIILQNKPAVLSPGRQTIAWLPAWSCPALCQTSRLWNWCRKQTTTVGFWCLRFCIVKTYREHEHVDIFEQGGVFLEIIFFEVLHVKLLGCSYILLQMLQDADFPIRVEVASGRDQWRTAQRGSPRVTVSGATKNPWLFRVYRGLYYPVMWR